MNRAARTFFISAVLAAACDRPQILPETPRFAVSAYEVLMDVTADEVPSYELLVTSIEGGVLPKPVVTVDYGAEWLSAEVTGSADPYKIVIRLVSAAFTAIGNYGDVLSIRAPGLAGAQTVTVNADVAPPSFRASTNDVRFQMEPGGDPPAPRSVMVTPITPTGVPVPAPTIVTYDSNCGLSGATDWIEAAVTTSGAGYVVTLTPVAAAIAALPLGTECHVGMSVMSLVPRLFEGDSRRYASTGISATLSVQSLVAPLVEASRSGLAFSALAGAGDPPPQTVTVVDALGGELSPPSLSLWDPWLSATLSGTAPPYTVTVQPHVAGLPAGTYYGGLTVGAPGSPSSDRIDVSLEIDEWARAGWTMPAMGLSATPLPDGRVLVAGGRGALFSDPGFQACAMTSPSPGCSGAAFGIGRMATPRSRHTATALTDGRVLAAGGVDGTALPVGTWEIYQPDTGNWRVERSLTTARFLHTATLLGDGRVLVTGGAVGDDWNPIAIRDAEILDPWDGSSPVAPMSTPRRDASAVRLPDGKVLVVGGQMEAGAALDTAELFDPASGHWYPTASMNEPRADAALVVLEDGRVLAAGGTDGQRALATAELYDPGTRTWSYTRSMAMGRVAPAVPLPSGNVLLVGGLTGDVSARVVTGTVERFEPATESWWWAGELHEPRTAHAVALLPGGLVVVAGGTRAPWDDGTLTGAVEIGFGEAP